jgi:hypothetical protein
MNIFCLSRKPFSAVAKSSFDLVPFLSKKHFGLTIELDKCSGIKILVLRPPLLFCVVLDPRLKIRLLKRTFRSCGSIFFLNKITQTFLN